jgi:hypothetical protein
MKHSVLVAVTQGNTEPWLTIWKEGQEKTWIQDNVDGSSIIHVQSKEAPYLIKQLDNIHEENRYRKKIGKWQGRLDKIFTKFISKKIPKYSFNNKNRILTANSWSTYYLQGRRNIALYDWFLKYTNKDFLFVTNTSSYINQVQLLKVIQNFNPSDTIYAGYLLPEDGGEQFVSGAGKLLSRKSVELIKNNWYKHTHETLEDVCLGLFMKSMEIAAIPLSRVSLPTPEAAKTLPDSILETEFHFRCKSNQLPRRDVEIMRILHERMKITNQIGQIE